MTQLVSWLSAHGAALKRKWEADVEPHADVLIEEVALTLNQIKQSK